MPFPTIYRCRCCGYAIRFNSPHDFFDMGEIKHGNGEDLVLFAYHIPDWEELTVEEYNGSVLSQSQN